MPGGTEPHREFVGILPTLLVATAALFGYLQLQPALTSSRPPSQLEGELTPPLSPPGLRAEHARLWQDPLSVNVENRSASDSSPPAMPGGFGNSPWAKILASLTAQTPPKTEYTDVERFAALVKEVFESTPGNCHHEPRGICLPVLLPGTPYADDQEQRMRIRYAVLAGLASEGYALKFPDRMSYVQLPVVTNVVTTKDFRENPLTVPVKLLEKAPDDSGQKPCPGEKPYPRKLFILWINEDQLGTRPLAALGQILQQLFPDPDLRKQIRLAILGPTNSSTLLDMAREHGQWQVDRDQGQGQNGGPQVLEEHVTDEGRSRLQAVVNCPRFFQSFWPNECVVPQNANCLQRPTVFSPRATIDVATLSPDDRRYFQQFHAACDGSGLRLVRTIGTDRGLVRALRCELEHRSAWPNSDNPQNVLVLLGEQETVYGRHFCMTVEAELKRSFDNGSSRDERCAADRNLRIIRYFRGIDGRRPKHRQDRHQNQRSDTTDDLANSSSQYDNSHFELPQGSAQLDYLRRVQDRILRLKQELRKTGRRISAIGIAGTDLYDKLLILRALRKHFPDACFFTTDVEARYSHPTEYDHSRNLIVASHFALELNKQRQTEAAPFRDSYQTAVYFSVRWMFNDSTDASDADKPAPPVKLNDPWHLNGPSCTAGDAVPEHDALQPLVFEIGRHRPYQLTRHIDMSRFSRTIHPQSLRELHWWSASNGGELARVISELLVPFVILYFLLWGLASSVATSPHTLIQRYCCNMGELAFAAAAVLAALFYFLIWTTWPSYSFLSRWSAIVATLFGVVLVTTAIPRTDKLLKALSVSYIDWPIVIILGSAYVLIATSVIDNFRNGGEPLEWNCGISLWPVTFVRLFAGLLAVLFLFRVSDNLTQNWHNDVAGKTGIKTNKQRSFWRCTRNFFCEENFRTKYGILKFHQWKGKRYDEHARSTKTICRDYHKWTTSTACRTIPAVLAFFAITFVLFGIEDSFRLPYRGQLSRVVAFFVLYVTALLLLILLFFIIDSIQATVQFITAISIHRQAWDEYNSKEVEDLKAVRNVERWKNESFIHPLLPARDQPSRRDLQSWERHPLNDLVTIRIIAGRTNVVGKLVYYPFIIILILLLARRPTFDHLGYPIALMSMVVVISAGLIAVIVNLRQAASRGRDRVLERLNNDLACAQAERNKAMASSIEVIIDEVLHERHGAFKPWTHDPVFGALLIPFSGAGGILLIETILQRIH